MHQKVWSGVVKCILAIEAQGSSLSPKKSLGKVVIEDRGLNIQRL